MATSQSGGGDSNPPVLSYDYQCESCSHKWQALSHQEIGLVCSKCQSSRIRAPSKRGAYKYKCETCDFKWKKKNSKGGTSFCPECKSGIPIYPYKFKPDAPKRMFGEFTCSACDRLWKSGNAWEGRKQQCQDCSTWNLPVTLRPLRPPQHFRAIQKPHPEDKCERCKELGYNCRRALTAASAEDDESVISTSDSSVVMPSKDREGSDVTPVPSDHGSDVADIDELVDELEELELQ